MFLLLLFVLIRKSILILLLDRHWLEVVLDVIVESVQKLLRMEGMMWVMMMMSREYYQFLLVIGVLICD